jgi:hypothetical protein
MACAAPGLQSGSFRESPITLRNAIPASKRAWTFKAAEYREYRRVRAIGKHEGVIVFSDMRLAQGSLDGFRCNLGFD